MIDLFLGTDVLPTFYPQNTDVLEKNVGDSKTDVLGGKVERRNVGPAILLRECRDRLMIRRST